MKRGGSSKGKEEIFEVEEKNKRVLGGDRV